MHSSVEYVVWFLGFQPGFPYLGSLPEQLHTPRRAEPRCSFRQVRRDLAAVEILSVAGNAGGWQLIGHNTSSPAGLLRDEPILLRPDTACALYRKRRRMPEV
ncbi:carboxyltransferase domain-containing protein [Escherichia coli]